MTTPTPEQVLRDKLERIAPVIFAAIHDDSMLAHTYSVDETVQASIDIAWRMIRECERVAREESKRP